MNETECNTEIEQKWNKTIVTTKPNEMEQIRNFFCLKSFQPRGMEISAVLGL